MRTFKLVGSFGGNCYVPMCDLIHRTICYLGLKSVMRLVFPTIFSGHVRHSNFVCLQFCWPDDCESSINWLCGHWKSKVVKGYHVTRRGYLPGYFDACDLCLLSQTYGKHPIRVSMRSNCAVR